MRQDYQEFQERGAEIIALGPDGQNAFKRYWQEQELPFIGCADIRSKVADMFYQEVNLLKFGRMPAIFVIDRERKIRFSHYGDSMSDIPPNEEIFKVLDTLENQKNTLLFF